MTAGVRRNDSMKQLYILGLVAFIGSFFLPATSQKMTSQYGEKVEVWTSPWLTHFQLAAEPLSQMVECFGVTQRRKPDDHGNSVADDQRERIYLALYSIPASCGWFIIALSVLVVPFSWMHPVGHMRLRSGLRIAGGVLLIALPFLTLAFYRDATLYKGYFHLGSGAYLIVVAYSFIGISLLMPFSGREEPEVSPYR